MAESVATAVDVRVGGRGRVEGEHGRGAERDVVVGDRDVLAVDDRLAVDGGQPVGQRGVAHERPVAQPRADLAERAVGGGEVELGQAVLQHDAHDVAVQADRRRAAARRWSCRRCSGEVGSARSTVVIVVDRPSSDGAEHDRPAVDEDQLAARVARPSRCAAGVVEAGRRTAAAARRRRRRTPAARRRAAAAAGCRRP